MKTNVFPNQNLTPTGLITNAANSIFTAMPIQNKPMSSFDIMNSNNPNANFNQSSFSTQSRFPNNTMQFGGNIMGNTQGFNNNQNNMFGNNTNNNFGTNTFNTPSFNANANANTQFNNTTNFSNNTNNSFNNINPTNSFNAAANSFNNATFGTNFNATSFNSPVKQNYVAFTPQKSKNPKIDGKHLIKSIAVLNQNVGFCLKQLRIRQMMGGQKIGMNTVPSTSSFGFGANNANTNGTGGFGFNKTNNIGGGITGFGGITNNNTNTSFNNTFANTNTFSSFNLTSPSAPSNTNFGGNTFGSGNKNVLGGGGNNILGGGNNFIGGNTNPLVGNPNTSFGTNMSFNNTNTFGAPNNTFGNLNKTTSAFQAPTNNSFGNFTTPQVQPQTNLSFGLNNNPLNSPSKPTTGLFAPVNNNSVTVFPSSSPNTTFGSIINNAAMSLATGGLNNPQPNPQGFNNNIFGSTPNMGNVQNQLDMTSNFLQSDLFKQMLMSTITRQKMADQNKKTKSQSSKLFNYDEDDDYVKIGVNQKLQSRRKKDRDQQKQALRPYTMPYFYNQSKQLVQNVKKREQLQQQQNQKFQPKPSNITRKKQSMLQFLKKTPFSQFQQNYDKLQKRITKQIKVNVQDLPINDCGLHMIPNIDKIATMCQQQIKQIKHVTLQNRYGKVTFLKPISLYRKKLSQCIEIGEDSIEVKDPQWQNVRCRITHKNFGGFANANQTDKKKIQRKMLRWAQKNLINITSFDSQKGDITYQTHF